MIIREELYDSYLKQLCVSVYKQELCLSLPDLTVSQACMVHVLVFNK